MSRGPRTEITTALQRSRGWLAFGVVVRAVIWAAATGALFVALVALTDLFIPIPIGARRALLAVDAFIAAGVFGFLMWRDRGAAELPRVALWIEERVPALRFALVTELESGGAARFVAPGAAQPWPGMARRGALRVVAFPVAALIAAAVGLMVLPAGSVARAASPRSGDSVIRTALARVGVSVNRLDPLALEITPPAYARRESSRVDDPAAVRALPGSRITFVGRGAASGVRARVTAGDRSTLVQARQAGDQWRIELTASATPTAVALSDGLHARVVDLEPERDAPPAVSLRAPVRDSVLALPRGTIALSAQATDDIALAEAHFEVIVSAGEGETFTFRTLTLGARTINAPSATIVAALSLDAAKLHPGDVLHIRAIATDGNVFSGPGVGTSDTRVLRIARPGEADSVAITPAAPPDTNQSALSERMLIQLTVALKARRAGLDRRTLLTESHSVATDQARLRRTVGDLVFARLGGEPSGEERTPDQTDARGDTLRDLLARADRATNQSIQTLDFDGGETPVVAVNAPLLEAYNAMWDAGGALEQGDLEGALPHMRAALAAIERSRAAERVYLRGRAPDVVVDVARARLAGTEHGSSSVRTPRLPVDSARDALASRLSSILARAVVSPATLADSLLLLRVEALSDQPEFASALGDAADALRKGQGERATTALVRARRALAGPIIVRRSIAGWSGAGQ